MSRRLQGCITGLVLGVLVACGGSTQTPSGDTDVVVPDIAQDFLPPEDQGHDTTDLSRDPIEPQDPGTDSDVRIPDHGDDRDIEDTPDEDSTDADTIDDPGGRDPGHDGDASPDTDVPLECEETEDCKGLLDPEPCATVECVDRVCTLVPVENDTPCNDGSFCTYDGVCIEGECLGLPVDCSDGNPCTLDLCVPGTGCSNPAYTGGCDDGDSCTDNDSCATGTCTGQPVVCEDDGNPCTAASCLANLGCVVENLSGTECSDNLDCTTNDTCVSGTCIGTAVVCDDENPCTSNACVEGDGCVFAPNTASCDDGDDCTFGDTCGGGTCEGTPYTCEPLECELASVCDGLGGCHTTPMDDGTGCGDPDNECTVGTCSDGACLLESLTDGTPCDDGSACSQSDSCLDGVCVGYDPVICAVTDPCQAGSCDPTTGTCGGLDKPDGELCNDGNACTLDDACQSGQCTGRDTVCIALNQCHDIGECNPLTGRCTLPRKDDGSPCDDNSLCTQTDECLNGTCRGLDPIACPDPAPCRLPGVCQPSTGTCTYEVAGDGFACDDGNSCTINDACLGGSCSGTSYACDDSLVCTDNLCDGLGGCTFELRDNWCLIGGLCVAANQPSVIFPCRICTPDRDPNNWSNHDAGVCSDGLACTLDDRCVDQVCEGTPIVCDDGNLCTTGQCVEGTGCVHSPNTEPCDDGDPCTFQDTCGSETCQGTAYTCLPNECQVDSVCDGLGGCIATPKTDGLDCTDDGNDCTWDRCVDGECVHRAVVDGTDCNDGSACTREDSCLDGVCVGYDPVVCPVTDPCQAGSCDPATGTCTGADKPDGDPCSDGNACTLNDQCALGQCTGTPRVCTAFSQCHEAGTCNVLTGICTNPKKAAGTPCNDGDLCTQTDSCQDGTCTGANPVVCQEPAACHLPGVCQPSTGTCTFNRMQNGSVCDDGNPCTIADACLDGTCGGTGYTCDDGLACTNNVCDGLGACTFPVMAGWCVIAGACVPADQVNVLNPCQICLPGTDSLGWSNNDAGTCSDGFVCTENDRCENQECVGATRVCNDNNPCTDDSCLEGTGCVFTPNADACNDDDPCTYDDQCALGSCEGTAYTCDIADCQVTSVCDGLGGCDITLADDDTPCTDDGNTCTTDVCLAGLCVHPVLADSTACDDSDLCTQTDACLDGVCVGSDPVVCAEPAACTNPGSCNPSTGVCDYEQMNDGSSCDDGNPCTRNDTCTGGNCAGTAYTCSDGLTCTTDACDGGGGCIFTPLPGWCAIDARCVGANVENIFNACQICLPDLDPKAWSNNESGFCSDDNSCSFDDRCVGGACQGTAYSCDDGLSCTSESCNGEGGCIRFTLAGWCLINGACYQNNQDNPENTCQRCASSTSQTSWSQKAPNASCNDGNQCTHTDVCLAGVCTGTAYSCNDGLDCTSDFCDGIGGCGTSIQEGMCLISGVCTEFGVMNPENDCQGCNPLASQVAWSPASEGIECDDGDLCTTGDICRGGICEPQAALCDDGLACTLDACNAGSCTNTIMQNWCVIDGVCRPDGIRAPGNSCLVCLTGITNTEWTITDGDSCDDEDVCTTQDRCEGSVCTGNMMECDDGVECTLDFCQFGGCRHVPAPGWCRIQGECLPDGATNPENPCQRCDASLLQTFWSPSTGGTCDDLTDCTFNDTCVSGSCRGTAYECDDGIACTADSCDGLGGCNFQVIADYCVIDGSCIAAGTRSPLNECLGCDPLAAIDTWSPRNGISCNDGISCTFDDTCSEGVCAGTTYVCNDEKVCTNDSCNGLGGCIHNVQSGSCLIDATCRSNLERNPSNQCQACIPSQSTSVWSMFQGATCNDDDACTQYDSCVNGVCGGVFYSCDDGKACTNDICLGEGLCDHILRAGFCLINNECRSARAINPLNGCQECDPARATAAWSPLTGTECDDRNGCTTSDTCNNGTCTGTPYSCSDGIVCTADLCDGVGGCSNPLLTGWCYIAEVCYQNGQVKPDNECIACASEVSTSDWTELNPGAVEICNGVDDNCDGITDPPNSPGCILHYEDRDGDGYGLSNSSMCLCGPQFPYLTAFGGDCDDDDRMVNPDSEEICDGKDNDCDGITDPEGVLGCSIFYLDVDGDAWGQPDSERCLCGPTGNWRGIFEGDCNDNDPAINPAHPEICDGKDNNCNGLTDVGAVDCIVFYQDQDNDGFGTAFPNECLCGPQGLLRATVSGDCNDQDPSIHPDAIEICDGRDNNCSTGVDDAPLAQMCPTDPVANLHGTVICGGMCTMICESPVGDIPGWHDNDMNIYNGCECQDDSWSLSGGRECMTAVDLGDLDDNGTVYSPIARIANPTSGDWWKVRAVDLGALNEPTGCDSFNVSVRFLANPGNTFDIDVFRGGCGTGFQTCDGGTESNWATNFRSGGFGECGCAPPTRDCLPPENLDECIRVHGPNSNSCGTCPGEGALNKNLCIDNTADFYIKVDRKPGMAPTCAPYQIEISNGLHAFTP